jgi:NAD+ kinase
MGQAVRRVGVVLKRSSAEAIDLGRQLLMELRRHGVEGVLDRVSAPVLGEPEGPERTELAAQVDLVVVLGGDGTLLSVTHGRHLGGTPILGINMGSLGFLTEHPAEYLFPALRAAIEGTCLTERRERLHVEVIPPGQPTVERVALNDAVINKSALARMVLLSVHVDSKFVSRFRADGLIVATPTGSTAYNLSAGGPIVHPSVEVVLITPICPHTLTNRPIAVPLTASIEVRLESQSEEVYLTLDGQEGFPLTPNDLVRIRRCEEPAYLVADPRRSFFQVLHHKLKWGDRGG